MVHRLHKAVVPHTNKNDIIRDLMEYQRDMHRLRFALEMEIEHDLNNSNGLCELARLGLFNSAYFEPLDDLLARGLDIHQHCSEKGWVSGDEDFFGIKCHGHPWPASLLASAHPDLPRNRLTAVQLVELYRAYETLGCHTVITNPKVCFYGSITYFVRGRAEATPEAKDVDGVDVGDREIRKVAIKAGDVAEFVDNSPDSFHGRGFGRVAAIMVHERTPFLVLTWIVPTGRVHPRLGIHEFAEKPLFYFAPFHPLTIVDHPRFVNRSYFTKLNGMIYLYEYVFDMV